MRRTTLAAAGLAASLLLAACAGAQAAAPNPDEPVTDDGSAAGMCHVDTPDCVDADLDPDTFDAAAARTQAEDLLGVAEDDLDPSVRIGRKGDNHMMLTEDYVIGRLTVELDKDDEGTYRVSQVNLELPDGPETIAR